jgi:hypothetical protein
MCDFWERLIETVADSAAAEQLCLRMLLISTPEEVTWTIHDLQARRFTEVRFWSPLLPIPDSDQVLSIYTRRGVQARE